jgi:hypothetical protein
MLRRTLRSIPRTRMFSSQFTDVCSKIKTDPRYQTATKDYFYKRFSPVGIQENTEISVVDTANMLEGGDRHTINSLMEAIAGTYRNQNHFGLSKYQPWQLSLLRNQNRDLLTYMNKYKSLYDSYDKGTKDVLGMSPYISNIISAFDKYNGQLDEAWSRKVIYSDVEKTMNEQLKART